MSPAESKERYERPNVNPFQPSAAYSDAAPTLVYAALETLAYVHDPTVEEQGVHPLVSAFSMLWAHRITSGGEESFSCAAAWELSVRVAQLESHDIPVPNWDITTRCEDEDCTVDHAAQYETINEFLHRSRRHDHLSAVRAYITHVRQLSLDEQPRAFVEGLSVLLVHIAMRVSDYRNGLTVELPKL